MSAPELAPGYSLHSGPPDTVSYLNLRVRAGLTPKTEVQAAACLPGGWCAFHIIYDATSTIVAMGRVIGDGGWYFHVIDMAVLPEHQRNGLGGVILSALLDRIREAAPGAYVNLLADPPGRALYRKFGFEETAPNQLGMSIYPLH